MTYTLYGDPGSGSATVELALAEIGIPVELRDVSLDKGQQHDQEYSSLNPQRKLPTLILPNGTVLTESVAILITLADRHPEAGLLPDAPRDRAIALRWLLFMATELYPVIEMHDYPERFQPEADATPLERRDELRAHALGIWMRRWPLLEAAVDGERWFLSSGISLVDIYAAVLSRWSLDSRWRGEHLPRIDAIARRVATRESMAPVWRRHFP